MCAMTYLGIAAKRSVKTDSNSRATDVGTHTHLHAAEGAEGTGGVLNQHAQAANQQISKSANQQQDENFLESAGAAQTSSASVFVLLY